MKPFLRRFEYTSIEQILVDQETDWSCVANATRMALRYFGYDAEEREIGEFLERMGYRTRIQDEFLLCFPHAALFLRLAGFDVTYRTTLAQEFPRKVDVITGQPTVRELLEEDMRNLEDNDYAKDCYRALINLMDLGGRVHLHQPRRAIQREDILRAIGERKLVIAYVTARQYYRVHEDWGHALVLVPSGLSFEVLDGFARKGYLDPDLRELWDTALENAKKFEWNNLVRVIEVGGDEQNPR